MLWRISGALDALPTHHRTALLNLSERIYTLARLSKALDFDSRLELEMIHSMLQNYSLCQMDCQFPMKDEELTLSQPSSGHTDGGGGLSPSCLFHNMQSLPDCVRCPSIAVCLELLLLGIDTTGSMSSQQAEESPGTDHWLELEG